MGMFDEVYVDPSVAKIYDIKHGNIDGPYQVFQTKAFYNAMEKYVLKFASDGKARLFIVDHPDKELAVPYTQEEIDEFNKNKAKFQLPLELGDTYFKEEHLAVENRNHRGMGELPHQYVEMGVFKSRTREAVDYNLKFTDGILVDVTCRIEILKRSKHPSGEVQDF